MLRPMPSDMSYCLVISVFASYVYERVHHLAAVYERVHHLAAVYERVHHLAAVCMKEFTTWQLCV